MVDMVRVASCHLCGHPLGDAVLSLGDQPVSNHLPRSGTVVAQVPRYALDVALCSACGLPQLGLQLPPTAHFHDHYVYLSGASSSWVAHCNAYAATLTEDFRLDPQDLVVELGSNDGTLLRAFQTRGPRVLGVEPSANVAAVAAAAGATTLCSFFNAETATAICAEHGPARCVIGNNVLAHVPDTAGFLRAARELLADDGFLCFEFPHFVHILDRHYFDTIYHEHYTYLGLGPLQHWASRNDMTIFDARVLPTHGGSLRVFLRRAREAATPVHVHALIEAERQWSDPEHWLELAAWLRCWRQQLHALLTAHVAAGRRVGAYGAASKATVICNFLGLTAADIGFCCDKNLFKQGCAIPGTGIPILPSEALLESRPDVIVVFAWNIFDEIRRDVADLLDTAAPSARPTEIVRLLPVLESMPLSKASTMQRGRTS